MKLYEYQAKEILKQHGVPVPASVLITTGDPLQKAIKTSGLPCVLKSQLLEGGRGKAGLIKIVITTKEFEREAKALFDIGVEKILIEEKVEFKQELYFSITINPISASIMLMASTEGGVDIEELAAKNPGGILKEEVNPITGLFPFQARNMAYNMGLAGQQLKEMVTIMTKLYKVFRTNDAELLEINPLFITEDGNFIAGDAKLIIDDSSSFRQTIYKPGRDYYSSEAEYEAALEGIPYLQFDGDISLMCAGAGLTNTVYDLINFEGGTVANYLEFGGPNYRKAQRAMELCLKNDSKIILIVTFGTIARADIMAQGVVDAIKILNPDRPIITCIRGTNEEEAISILEKAGLKPIFDTEEAVRTAVSFVKRGKK
jgi:succinyl-CoA synthetase beta subunit